MELENNCELIKRSLHYYANYIENRKDLLSCTIPDLIHSDLRFQIKFLQNLKNNICKATETDIIKNNKVISESLYHYSESLKKELETLNNNHGIKSFSFENTEKEIDQCKKLSDTMSVEENGQTKQ